MWMFSDIITVSFNLYLKATFTCIYITTLHVISQLQQTTKNSSDKQERQHGSQIGNRNSLLKMLICARFWVTNYSFEG